MREGGRAVAGTLPSRYFAHALAGDADRRPAARLAMTGRIKLGAWLPFTADEDLDGRSFEWRCRVGRGLLSVVDRFHDGHGGMDVRLFGRARVVHATGADVDRSAAARAFGEAIWTPAALLPERGVEWRSEGDDVAIASADVGVERPEIRLELAPDGALRRLTMQRWRDAEHGYLPFTIDVHEERTFAGVTIPSSVTGAWDGEPFFEGRILDRVARESG